MAEIKIHSITSLITNSSTTIFTYSENSEAKVRELFTQLMKDFGINKSFDELFSTILLLQDSYLYLDYLEDYNEHCEENDIRKEIIKQFPQNLFSKRDIIHELYCNVSKGILPKPDWFKEAEEYLLDGDSITAGTTLFINAKEEKYQTLADKIFNLIYSTTSEIYSS